MSDILSDAAENLNEVEDTVTAAVSSKTKRFPKLHKFVNKRNLIIVQGGIVVLVILTVGVALYQRNENIQAAQAAAIRQDAIKAEQVRAAELTALKARIATLEAQKQAACSNYQALSTARATRSLVVVPNAVGCNDPR